VTFSAQRPPLAHGYLTLSLATALVDEVVAVSDAVMVVDYGVDRVRFPAPLRYYAAPTP
jgi:acyl dehydratase